MFDVVAWMREYGMMAWCHGVSALYARVLEYGTDRRPYDFGVGIDVCTCSTDPILGHWGLYCFACLRCLRYYLCAFRLYTLLRVGASVPHVLSENFFTFLASKHHLVCLL